MVEFDYMELTNLLNLKEFDLTKVGSFVGVILQVAPFVHVFVSKEENKPTHSIAALTFSFGGSFVCKANDRFVLFQ